MMTDPIADMLTRIRNAVLARHEKVSIPSSKLKRAIAAILEKEGYVQSVNEKEERGQKQLVLTLKYNESGVPAITTISRVSTSGRRVYRKKEELPNVRNGYGMAVVSTPEGLMTNREARKRKLGGEIICEIY